MNDHASTRDRQLDRAGLNLLFHEARTFGRWSDRPVEQGLLRRLWELTALGPTSYNSEPARVVFLRSAESKERLRPHLSAGNLDKTMSAPVTAILAYDLDFHEKLPQLGQSEALRERLGGADKAAARETAAFRNASLQGGYFILAARALGLDCGPMSGFDNAGVDRTFFAGTSLRSNFLCNLGYGDREGFGPRRPRLRFEEACEIL